MFVTRRFQQLLVAVAILALSFFSLSIGERTLDLLGYSVTSLGSLVQFIELLLVVTVGLFILLIVATTLIGYFVITGWRRHNEIPKGIKLLASLLVGVVIVILSAPLGLLIPIPFVPTAATAVIAWYMLRKLSDEKISGKAKEPDINKIEQIASQHIRTQAGETDPIRTLELQKNGNEWNGLFLAGTSGTPYRLKLEADNAKIISSQKIVSAGKAIRA